jgi:ribosomal protein S18 acetylase RimI-like enzyme
MWFKIMPHISIRAAKYSDIPGIVNVRLEALTDEEVKGFTSPEPSIFTSRIELRNNWLKNGQLKDGFQVYIVEDAEKVAGFIVFKIGTDSCYIDNIVVVQEKQGKSRGRALVEHVEEMARTQGCRVVITDTTENVEGVPWKSYGFWIKMGYRDTGERLSTNYDYKEIPLIKLINTRPYASAQTRKSMRK